MLIVDAMDESNDCDREDIASFLKEISLPAGRRCVAKGFLASRPINEIHHVIIPVHQRIRLQEKNSEDIEKYTCHLLEKPKFSHCSGDTKERIRNYIVKNADGVFLWCVWLVMS